jgi:hypothetical protein
MPRETCDRTRSIDNFFTVPLDPLDTFGSFDIQRYCMDDIYLGTFYTFGSITCFPRHTCCPSQHIKSLGHVLGMLGGIQRQNRPNTQITQYIIFS